MEENRNYPLPENVPAHIDSSRFKFVHSDPNEQIKDEKIQRKATTFGHDAFKRFVANKSSVVGAIIIGILLIASFLAEPISPYDIQGTYIDQALLPAKLFDAGTGWWDGCKHFTNQPYDGHNQVPATFSANAIVENSLVLHDEEYIDQQYEYAYGGYVRVTAKSAVTDSSLIDSSTFWFAPYETMTLKAADEVKATFVMGDTDDISDGSLCDYRVLLENTTTSESIVLQEWGKPSADDETITLDLSAAVSEQGLESVSGARLRFEGKPELATESTDLSYFLVKSVSFSSSSTDEDTLAALERLTFTDANYTAGLNRLGDGTYPDGYWRSTGTRNVYHATVSYCDFDYDIYEYIFGEKEMVVGQSIFDGYIKNGYCEFSDYSDPDTFKILDAEKCPVLSVSSSSYNSKTEVYQMNCTVVYYKYLGYDAPPRYIFGTDSSGRDLLTRAFSSLKNSLLVAIIASAICLAIGLIWGSISGYFGGAVDIIMERFTDILSGIPWIVLFTIIMLHMKQSIFAFGVGLCLTGWIGTASTTRTQFYRFRDREYVLASRTLGASNSRLIFRHILPNGLGTIVTASVLMIPDTIYSEATLSYLGLGLKGVESFGVILSENQQYLYTYPPLIIVPTIIIALLMISFNLFGNGLRDALNPSLKGSE